MKKYTKGFTLIELLVVIAIIGILASVVLVSLNSARTKGKDARIISDVQQLRTAFESGYNGASYPDLASNRISNAASSSTAINQLVSDMNSQGGSLVILTDGATATRYTILGSLQSNTGFSFCIASNGTTAQATTTSLVTAVGTGC